MPLEFSKGTKALFSGLQDFASQNLPRPATYSDPYGGALAQPLPRAFYRYVRCANPPKYQIMRIVSAALPRVS